jgi:hypothetical protein
VLKSGRFRERQSKGAKLIRLVVIAMIGAFACITSAQAQTLDLQAMCAAQAKKAFQEYTAEDKVESAKWGSQTTSLDYQSHYNTKIKKCLILTDKESFLLNKNVTSINLWDAFERRNYASWLWQPHETKKYWEQPPMWCELAPSYKDKKNCTTREEFDAFVAEYMEE